MKHKSTTFANGLCTPPCGSSQSKSTRFSLFTSLLLFFLLIVGNSAAWGRTPTIYGEGLPGLNTCSNCGNWDNNTKVMQSMGEDGYWYAEFLDVDATDNNKYRFKIAINDGEWWNGAMNSGNTNESMGNVDVVAGKSEDNQISFKMPFDGDVYVFYKSSNADNSKVWIIAVPQNVAAAPNNSGTRKLKTDIILKDGSNDWTSDGIKFAKNDAVSTYKHVTSYVLPAKKSTEGGAIRFEMCYGGTPDVYISGKSDGRPAALSSLTPRRIIYLWDGNNHNNNTDNNNVGWISYTLPTYPMRKSGWKLFVKDYNSGNPTTMDANGSATLTLNGGSSYEFFIANTDYATNLSTYSLSAAATYPAVHSVNWFGGCYIDQSNSSNVTFNDIQVYKSDKLGTLTHPVVDSHHLQGKFQVSGSGSKDVTFTFDGGKITINAVDHGAAPEPEPTPDPVIYAGGEIFYFHKKGGSLQSHYEDTHAGQGGNGAWVNDCALFLEFSNANESSKSRSTKIAYFWDTEGATGDVLGTRVPAGTWSKVRVLRTNNGDRGQVWETSDWVTLEEGKNYLNDNNTMAVYSPRTFHFYISGSTTLADTGSDFNAWNGNGTAHSGSMTKTLNAGTYKFKLNPTGTVDWRSEFNTDDLDLTNSSDNINLRNGGNKEIWFDLATRSEVTIACDGNKVTVNATPYVPALTDENLYVFGDGGTNWVTGWTKNVEDYKMTITTGIASKTFYNVSGSGLNFKVWNQTNSAEYDWSKIDESSCSGLSSLSNCSANNICFNLAQKSDVTVYTDGTKVWLTAVPSPAHFGANQYVFWHSNAGSWGTILAGRDRTQFLEFRNTSTSATSHTSKPAFMFEAGPNDGDNYTGVIAAIAPEGTWNQVRVCRINSDTWNGSPIEGSSDWFTIEDGKNYIYKEGGVYKFGTKSLDNFQFYLAASSSMGEGDNFVWNGNGTVRTNSVTKTLSANDYGFKLNPTGAYIYSNRNYWVSEFNWDDIDASNSSNNISLRNGGNKEIWFTLSRKSDVTIACDGIKVTVNATPYYNVTFNSDGGSDVAAQEILSGGTVTEPSDPTGGSGYTFNFWKLSGESSAYDFSTPVTSDIELVADWTAPTMHTVTFNTDGGSTIDEVQVAEGNPVAQPADPTKTGYNFVEWQLSGSTYNFESPVMDDIELVAVWSFKAIESVNLNKSTLILYENSDPQTLTPSYLPADVLGVTYEWIVAPAGVVSVVNGVVTVVAPGTATITCTATDAESNSQNATCSVTVYEGEGCEMEEQSIFSHVIFGNSTTGGSASNNLLDQAALNPGMESTCRTIKMYYNGLTSEFTADEAGVVKAKSGLSDHSDVWYEIKGGTNANSYDGNFYYLKNVATGGYITRGDGIYGGNDDWKFYTTVTTPTNGKTNLYQFIYAKKDNQDNQKRICSVWNYNGTGSNQTYGLHRRNQDWADNYGSNCPNPMIVFGRGVNQGNQTLSVNFTVVATGVANPDYLSTPIVYDTRSYYRFSADAAVSLTLDKKLRAEDKVVVYCYNPSNAASNGALYINNNKVSDIQITANSALAFEYVAVDGDAGVNTIEVKSDDSNFCMASIEVLRSLPVIEQDPALTWSAPATHYTTVAAGSFTYVASSAKSLGAITYTSSDEAVATVANGVVTPLAVGTAKITASIEQFNCFGERSISYDVVVELPLQDAIDANSSLTLTHDYAEDAIINKAITINGNDHSIGNLTVQMAGDLTLSGALTVNDFSIYGQAGNSSVHATSGQVRNADNLTANGNAYFYYTIEPGEHVQHGWYDFTVPFPVNTASGIKGIQDAVLNDDFAYGTDYAILEHLGDKQAAGEYAYKKFQGVMTPCRLYSITLDDDYNYKTLRFQKTNDGALVAADAVTLNAYEGGDAGKANWNGVGNGTLHHANVGVTTEVIQVYQSGNNSFMAVAASSTSLAIGTAFMVQEAGTMTLGQASHALLAPRRAASVQPTAIQIASEGQPFSDQLFISADEMAGQVYTQGADVAKAGNIGNVNVPQIWTNAYNSKLCAHEAQLINGEASYTLSLYAPANGSYTLTSKNIPEGYTLYLTQNGNRIWNLSESYVLDLTKGTATEYGLLLVENYKMPTAIENIGSQADETQKIMRNGILYILRNGKVFNAQGARVQ